MTEEAELRAKIARLKAQNEQKRRAEPYPSRPPYAPNHPYLVRGAGRWAPRGRGGRGGYYQPVQNHVWVAGGTQTPPSTEPTPVPRADIPESSPAGKDTRNGFYIGQYSTGKQEYMSKETYEREQKQKQEFQQARATEAQQKAPPPTPTKASAQAQTEKVTRQIQIEGISFRISKDGSKLVRMSDVSSALQETPKKTTIAGVDFHRTKRGNLLRAPAQGDATRFSTAAPKPQCETFTRQGNLPSSGPPSHLVYIEDLPQSGTRDLHGIVTDNSAGSCPFGRKCRFDHDPDKVSICKGLLLNGTCPAGEHCDMSHEMTYHRVSACTHFLRGNCTNDACRYPHVNISPSAPVCRAFATLGYCASGEECARRHVFECPDYANRGTCTNQKCQLPHVDRASTMRKAAQRKAKMGSDAESDLSSDEGGSDGESEIDDVDLNDKDAVTTGLDDSHELSQQQDYISFS